MEAALLRLFRKKITSYQSDPPIAMVVQKRTRLKGSPRKTAPIVSPIRAVRKRQTPKTTKLCSAEGVSTELNKL